MDSRVSNNQFRSVPLIQRSDLSRYSASADERREHVSAYLDESTVVSVTPRGKRRSGSTSSVSRDGSRGSRTGFTLVPNTAEEERRYSRSRQDQSRDAGRRATDFEPMSFGYATPGYTSFASAMALGGRYGVAQEDAYGRSYGAEHEGSYVRGIKDRAFADNYDDYERGVSKDGGRFNLLDTVKAVPGAVGSVLFGALSHMHVGIILVLSTMALSVIMLYGPLRDLYVANRKLDALQETYDVLVEENESIQGDLDLLQTREGIENEARARGYVEKGETKVVVDGLPEEEVPDAAADAVSDVEVPDNRTWQTRMLDQLFGYEPGE